MPAQTEDEQFFAENAPSPDCEAQESSASEFVHQYSQANSSGRPIVVVTSGGTTVNLEKNTVRFIDNFSVGTRGATSAEEFLKHDYAVVFLHRRGSMMPFARQFTHNSTALMDLMTVDENGRAVVEQSGDASSIHEAVSLYKKYKNSRRLHQIPYTTVIDYIWLLRMLSQKLQPLAARTMFYLAAAVSDFFIPALKMAQHKIQSSQAEYSQAAEGLPASGTVVQEGKLTIMLEPVPKFLAKLVTDWAPAAMIVSFKLETDPDILVRKARGALEKYHHRVVIGNLLETRAKEVVLVEEGKEARWVRKQDTDKTLEAVFIPQLVELQKNALSAK